MSAAGAGYARRTSRLTAKDRTQMTVVKDQALLTAWLMLKRVSEALATTPAGEPALALISSISARLQAAPEHVALEASVELTRCVASSLRQFLVLDAQGIRELTGEDARDIAGNIEASRAQEILAMPTLG